MVRLDAVDAAPTRLERDLAAGAEPLFLDDSDHRGARIPRRRVEDGEEAFRDQVEDAALVGRERFEIFLDVGRDDRVVVVDLRVVDHAPERKLVEGEYVLGAPPVVVETAASVAAVGFNCGTMSPDR